MLKSVVAGVVLGLASLTMASPASAGLAPEGGITIKFNESGSSAICHTLTGALNYDWEEDSPGGTCPSDEFEGRANGGIIAPFTGEVQFCGSHDDGLQLEIDGTMILDDLNQQGPEDCNEDGGNSRGEIIMVEGECYPLELYFYEAFGGAALRVEWTWTEDPFVVVPSSAYVESCGDFDFYIDVRGLLPRTEQSLPETGRNLAGPLTLGVVFLGLGLVLARRRGAMPVR